MTEEHADETMVASMRADAERQGADDRKVTDAPHYLARVLMANGIRNMYGVVGIPVTDFARIAQGMGMRFVGMRHEEDAVNAAAADGFITGRPAVTLTVSAPGFLNGLPALLEATVNGYPVIIIGGSDAPVEMVNPFHGLYAGVTRMTRAGEPEGGWYANQKVTREEALRAFTIWAAYGQFEEDLKGSLEPGKLADFVVIDRDYMTCPEEEIKDIQALMTVSGGEVVYTKDTSEPTLLWQGKPVTLLSGALIEQPGTIYASASDLAGNISAVLEQGEGTVTVTCGEQSAELPVKTVNGADYVPVRAFFEGIGYAVTWCPDSRTVSTSRMSTADTSEAAAQPPVDEYSFQLGNFDGTVGAFCDVIMTGAKELAFSDPFDPEDEPLLTSYVAKKCEGYGVKYYIDKDLLLTKLFSTVEMDGQWVYILYADDAVLQEYLELKQEEKDMIAAGTYTEKAQIDLATRYGKLMGYSDAHIAASIAGA